MEMTFNSRPSIPSNYRENLEDLRLPLLTSNEEKNSLYQNNSKEQNSLLHGVNSFDLTFNSKPSLPSLNNYINDPNDTNY